MSQHGTIGKGVLLAALAALLFGAATPFLQLASRGFGALASGALLYLGAALLSLALMLAGGDRGRARARLPWPRVLLVALVGGALAPALLVFGLRDTDAATGSLLLVLEAPFTVALAALVFREHVARRALVATMVLVAAGAVLAGWPTAGASLAGALLIVLATLGWSVDNLLSRRLSDFEPLRIVGWKGALGGAAAAAGSALLGEPWPDLARALALLGIGALGFGLSLRLYLGAQRVMGAARTASVFSISPFIGAVATLLLEGRWPSLPLLAASALVALGLFLHATESHAHWHEHGAEEHEHLHSHDDGHHDHAHDPMPHGAHSHPHHHEAFGHDHAHGEDLHHRAHH